LIVGHLFVTTAELLLGGGAELLLFGLEELLFGVALLLFGVGGTYVEELLFTGGTYALEEETTGAS
jgi:hypothetical protein